MYYSIHDKRILGWKYYQHYQAMRADILEHPHVKVIPSVLAAALIVVIVAQVLAFIDNRLEIQAMEKQRVSYDATSSSNFKLIKTAEAASISAKKMIVSAKEQDVLSEDMVTVTFAVKNTGTKTWTTGGRYQVYAIDGSAKSIKNAEVLATLKEEVKPGRLAYFTAKFPAGKKTGIYKKRIVLINAGKKIYGTEHVFGYTVKAKPVVVPTVEKPAPAVVSTVPTVSNTPTKVVSSGDCYRIASTNNNPCPVSAEGPLIRIGVFSSTEPQTIIGTGSLTIIDSTKNVLATVSAGTAVTLDYLENSGNYQYSYNGNTFTSAGYLTVTSSDANNVITVSTYENRPAWKPSINDNTFLGSFEIRYNSNKNRTWMINILPMETYLKGTAEVGNDGPVEYLKTMAIAERTYATNHLKLSTKHADEYFTLDATLDQVYKGYGTQQRMNNLVSAVEATKGIVVTYNNEVVLTPYYSWSDGRTRSMLEVWKVDKPWLQSVKEPAGYDKTTLYGHGVGLSGRGAYILANDQKYTYDQILKFYYTGVQLSTNYNNVFPN